MKAAPWLGFWTLCRKEILRYLKVTVQTLLTPVVTALLYLAVFAQVLAEQPEVYPGVGYVAFLVPGLAMMTVIQNAFANSSSSLIQSKMVGSLVFVLVAPISAAEFYLAFVLAAVTRGLLVGAGVLLATAWFVDLPLAHAGWALAFVVLAGAALGGLGVIAGVVSDKFEQLAAFQNFVVLPLSFLSGVFYSIHALPPLWAELSRFNPFFYMIDGFRYGFFGVSDVAPATSLAVVAAAAVTVAAVAVVMLARGYKIRL
ncbi:ABC transporter permease [Inmirania thermothiophila]|uniref:Transport permease protein n=1 Tax=Inmirania thermothiophila TaxID=1750597 RepID=A0A3N1XX32_9GAMM|nr:ABC transporter permease [Inmirania thermothiophila]ROR29772.1 ABC-2 type transport system permease protein [Inmirania thermothiophila]